MSMFFKGWEIVLLAESKISLFSIWKAFNAHHTNLMVQILFQIPIMRHIEELLLVPLFLLFLELKKTL